MNRTVRAFTAALMRSPARHVLRPLITPLDRFLFHVSGGRWKLSAPMIPSLVLYTIGAKTGIRREIPLMCFPQADGSFFIAGSNFGLEKHPAWSGNLIANPEAEVHYRRRLIPVRARLLPPAEREATWPALEEQWPHYRDYEKTAHRDIRVFHLEPR
ncbi:nitroreductase family deazaflavin-dependent oxidoreductase [Antiquaquibacter soli]|uniref:Nitroreductase family deazaflavin-dependent oxidoreductase n=1 Tax=Antiquaquibacter soli TaxID=3064523 RepID=A0ABT9BME1_9MICO|nr:nitroreductase family deazaflavin-dependent oxidoreductase [Protaetiibacter sp. WY-16]MDO7882199.1 nitroreductase family deazaflavin-dependent oxidoreductase [Protaetiibacter sp. WY-16]